MDPSSMLWPYRMVWAPPGVQPSPAKMLPLTAYSP